jgi:hypothetical protein
VIKGPARSTALSKPCSLLGWASGFTGSRVEETEAHINRKYRNSKVFVKSATACKRVWNYEWPVAKRILPDP